MPIGSTQLGTHTLVSDSRDEFEGAPDLVSRKPNELTTHDGVRTEKRSCRPRSTASRYSRSSTPGPYRIVSTLRDTPNDSGCGWHGSLF